MNVYVFLFVQNTGEFNSRADAANMPDLYANFLNIKSTELIKI